MKKEQKVLSKKKLLKSDKIFIFLMLLYPLINFIIFYVYVNANSVLMAFQETDLKTFKSAWVGIKQFERFFNEIANSHLIGLYIKNALLYFIITLIIGFPFNMLFAYMFFIKIKGTTAFRMMVMIPAMISGLVTAMLFTQFAENAVPSLFMDLFGIETATLLKDLRFNFGVIVVYSLLTGFSSQVIIYCNAMNSISDSLVEAAQLDGASHVQILLHLCVPNIFPTITTYMVTGVAGIFACSGGILYLFYEYNAPSNVTSLGYYIFTMTKNNDMSRVDYSYSSAISLIFTIITLPLVMITKYLFERFDPNREV